MATTSFYVTLTHLTCGHDGCGIAFAVPEAWREARARDHQTFYCPNGHHQWYPSGGHELETRAKAAEAKSARLQAELDQSRAARESADRRASAYKGQVTKIKRRIAAGVCPCCRRSFKQVRRHMTGQHPEFMEQWSL